MNQQNNKEAHCPSEDRCVLGSFCQVKEMAAQCEINTYKQRIKKETECFDSSVGSSA